MIRHSLPRFSSGQTEKGEEKTHVETFHGASTDVEKRKRKERIKSTFGMKIFDSFLGKLQYIECLLYWPKIRMLEKQNQRRPW